MFRNYLTVAFRNLVRNKVYSAINIFGLSVGIAFCILVFLFVQNEWTYDRFHRDVDRIYRVYWDKVDDGRRFGRSIHRIPVAPVLAENVPDLRQAVRLYRGGMTIRRGEKTFSEKLCFADALFFDLFTFPLELGDAATALKEPFSVVLSAEMAVKYFGEENPLGRQITVQARPRNVFPGKPEPPPRLLDFTVTGVARRIPSDSSVQFDFLMPFNHVADICGPDYLNRWTLFVSALSVYVKLPPGVSPAEAEEKLAPVTAEHLLRDGEKPEENRLRLQPMTAIHLNTAIHGPEPASDPVYSYILAGIAALVLLIACINFMNLAIGRSFTRAREVGVRKVVGAGRMQLVRQFWGESLLLSVLALLAGIALAELFLPAFNSLTQKELTIDYAAGASTLIALAGMALLASLIAGSYPAVFLSRINPVGALKGGLKVGDRNLFGRALVILQFALSAFLIVSAMIVYRQVDYMKTRDLGFDSEQIAVVPLWGLKKSDRLQALDVFRNELMQYRDITGISGASGVPFRRGIVNLIWQHEDERVKVGRFRIDHDLLDMLGMKVIAGRAFDRARGMEGVLVNEAWMRAFEWETHVDKQIEGMLVSDARYGKLRHPPVIGVVKDFHCQSLHHEIVPMIFIPASDPNYLYIKIHPQKAPEALARIKETWRALAPTLPFDFFFLDEHIDRQYRDEDRWGRIIGYASFFAILIASLGAFGLVALSVTRRIKEIGIRKALGASASSIVLLFSREFVKLVFVANLVAWPVAYLVMSAWLQDFAYRVDLDIWTFAAGGALTLALVLLSVCSQAIKAATANPVDALRYE